MVFLAIPSVPAVRPTFSPHRTAKEPLPGGRPGAAHERVRRRRARYETFLRAAVSARKKLAASDLMHSKFHARSRATVDPQNSGTTKYPETPTPASVKSRTMLGSRSELPTTRTSLLAQLPRFWEWNASVSRGYAISE